MNQLIQKKTLMVALAMVAALVLAEGHTLTISLEGLKDTAKETVDKVTSLLQLDAVVNIGNSELGGPEVKVDVPAVYELDVEARPEHEGIRIIQSVLDGLVDIYIDRTRDPETGQVSGPISVSVGGEPIYQNEEAAAMDEIPTC